MSITLLKMKVNDEGGQRLLVLLEKNAERGAQLVRHVLAFGRGAEGQRIEVQTLDVAEEVGQIIKDTFPKNVRFELVLTGLPWTVVVSPADLRHLREITTAHGLAATLLPDYSETLDGVILDHYCPLPSGGTTLDEIAEMPRAAGTLDLTLTGKAPAASEVLGKRECRSRNWACLLA